MRRKAVLLAALAGTVVALTLSASATAGTNSVPHNFGDPQTTNVPYLAWDGGQIRLVKCFTPAQLPVVGVGRFVIEDWSGNPFFKPQFENSGVNGTDGPRPSSPAQVSRPGTSVTRPIWSRRSRGSRSSS